MSLHWVGKSIPRVDAAEKLQGKAQFTDDLRFEQTPLIGRVLRSPHAHARILKLDARKALALPGVHAVISGQDFPRKIGLYLKDRCVLAVDRVRFVGEPVAAVVADSEAIAESALSLIEVVYEPLPAVFEAEAALQGDAPIIHPDLAHYESSDFIFPRAGSNISNDFKLRKGSPEEVWPSCTAVIEETFQIPHIQHTPLEPHVGLALAESSGQVTLWAAVQSPFAQQRMLADWLQMPEEKMRVIAPYIGGGFGSKAGVTMEALPVAMALKVPGRLVQFRHTREEEFYGTFVRQALTITIKLGCDAQGKLLAMDNRMVWNGGAYTEYGVNIARAAGYSCTGPYFIPHVHADSCCVYTNHPVGGAYRGFGMSELHTAVEQSIELLAEKMGMDALAFRQMNLIQAGQELATGMRMHPHGLSECLQAVADALDWQQTLPASQSFKRRGRGLAVVWKAPAMPTNASSNARIRLSAEGVVLNIGGQEIGQGVYTAAQQIAAESMQIPLEDFQLERCTDTRTHAYEWQTVASRITWSMGNAISLAGTQVNQQLFTLAADLWQESPQQIGIHAGVLFSRRSEREISYRELLRSTQQEVEAEGHFMPEYLTALDAETGQGQRPVVHFTVGAQGFDLEVDTRSGEIEILRAISAFDVGKAINPQLVRGQMEGGMLQGISSALFEELLLDQGRILNPSFVDYRIATAADLPRQMQTLIIETPQDDGPWGARGIGEHPMIPSIAALANAIAQACGRRLKNPPFTAEKLYWLLRNK